MFVVRAAGVCRPLTPAPGDRRSLQAGALYDGTVPVGTGVFTTGVGAATSLTSKTALEIVPCGAGPLSWIDAEPEAGT